MRIYLDDERETPTGWVGVSTVQEVIELLKNNEVKELSLDHDLGTEETGYDVVLWLEEKVIMEGFIPPMIRVHSSNPAGRDRMLQGIEKINQAQ